MFGVKESSGISGDDALNCPHRLANGVNFMSSAFYHKKKCRAPQVTLG